MAALGGPPGTRRRQPCAFRIVERPVLAARTQNRYSDQVARLARVGVVARSSTERASPGRDPYLTHGCESLELAGARTRRQSRVMALAHLVSHGIGDLEAALRAAVRDTRNCSKPTVRPERGWCTSPRDVKPRKKSRGEQMSDSSHVLEPGPRRMPLDRFAKPRSCSGFVRHRARIGVLENPGRPRALAARDALEKDIYVAIVALYSRRRPPSP
jgi:hypothetical protein